MATIVRSILMLFLITLEKLSGINEQIALATDPAVIASLHDKIFYLNFARLMLLGLFLFICSLVYVAFLKRRREGRATL